MASAYDPHPDREYAAIRSAAALIDVSPLFKYLLKGRDAARLLDRMVTRDVTKCRVGLEDVSESVGALSLQGPLSRAVLQNACAADFAALKYFRLLQTSIRDVPVTISRTGYTGDLGYEIWVDAERA